MKDHSDMAPDHDEIDVIIDELMAHPSRAEDLKKLLRQKILEPDVVRVLRKPVVADIGEPEDMWDNVPV